MECPESFFVVLVDACIFEYLAEDFSDFLFQDMINVVCVDLRIGRKELVHPVRVFLDLFVAPDVFAFEDVLFQQFHLAFQTCRKHGKSHDFDQADVFFLDVMKLRVGMIDAQRVLLCGDVVTKGEIQFVHAVFHACDRCDRVVRRAVCLGEDECLFVGVGAPFSEDVVGKVDDALCVFPAQTDHGQRPFYDAGLHIFVSGDGEVLCDRRFRHGKCIVSALEMIVA